MSLLDSLADFVTGTYTVTRTQSAGYDSKGRQQAGSVTTFTVDGSAQPINGRDLMLQTEAQHAEETKWFYTATELRTRYPGFKPDVVTINNEVGTPESWVVFHVERWNYEDETFWRCQIARRDVP